MVFLDREGDFIVEESELWRDVRLDIAVACVDVDRNLDVRDGEVTLWETLLEREDRTGEGDDIDGWAVGRTKDICLGDG